MASKKKVTKQKGGKTADDNDDWDAILAAETQANEVLKPVAEPVPEKAQQAAAGDDDDEDDDEEEGDGAAGAKKVCLIFIWTA